MPGTILTPPKLHRQNWTHYEHDFFPLFVLYAWQRPFWPQRFVSILWTFFIIPPSVDSSEGLIKNVLFLKTLLESEKILKQQVSSFRFCCCCCCCLFLSFFLSFCFLFYFVCLFWVFFFFLLFTPFFLPLFLSFFLHSFILSFLSLCRNGWLGVKHQVTYFAFVCVA